MLRKISTWFDQEEETLETNRNYKKCDHLDCKEFGQHKAPKNSRSVSNHHDLNQWYWFCKNHVREYNAKWNFYKNMTDDQAYRSFKSDQTWNRPTWSVHQSNQEFYNYSVQDPFHILNHNSCQTSPYLNQQEKESVILFNLTYPFSLEQLQISYRNLVKQHHPDIHQTKECEEQIRQINHAYQILKKLARTL